MNYTKEQLDFIYENAKLNKESGYWESRGSDRLEALFRGHKDMTGFVGGEDPGWGEWIGGVPYRTYKFRNVPPQTPEIHLSSEELPEEGRRFAVADFGREGWVHCDEDENYLADDWGLWVYTEDLPPIPKSLADLRPGEDPFEKAWARLGDTWSVSTKDTARRLFEAGAESVK